MNSEQINEALERFKVIWANVECGISIIDAETREIIDINPVAARMFGGDKSEIIGKRCHKFICPAEEHSCPIMDKNQVVDRSERKFVKANGDVIPIVKSVAKISYDGRTALLESFTDISNLKKAEEQLRLMTITEQANKAKSDFLSRMSHEMRTPMNAIIGMTKIAAGTDEIEKLKYCLATIEQSSTHLLALINDILDMSKIEAGKFELHNAVLRIEEVLKKICNLIMEQTERKDIKLNVFLDTNACIQYIGDELRLSQVITNLISNAVKFTPLNGEITVTVRETERREKNSVLLFDITDTGIGMTEEQSGKLFHAFEQADTSISRRFGGTGLGLAISKSIVEKMGGKIWVESESGKGSSFTFEIELEHTTLIEEKDKNADLKGMKILVASNDGRICEYFKSVVSGCGVVAETTTNVNDMISLVNTAYDNKRLYDMIFLDYGLRCDDIFGIAKKLNEKTAVNAIVLMASFLTWNKIDAQTRGAGINRFLSMPLLPSNIFNSLRLEDVKANKIVDAHNKIDHNVPDLSNVTILLAEDIEINREIFIALLKDTKINIDAAENGLTAVDKFKQNPDKYDMIIMDVHMPEMDGYEATRAIRRMDISKAKTIPVIAMTADVFREDVEKCLACGMNDHLAKPIDEAEVKRKISAYAAAR
ncbi:MAG: response regulator [Acidobacteriota bacterium]|jgi:PAS domain S-box-containing protein|nr:response regulator [Acidobacteriota bacterium]